MKWRNYATFADAISKDWHLLFREVMREISILVQNSMFQITHHTLGTFLEFPWVTISKFIAIIVYLVLTCKAPSGTIYFMGVRNLVVWASNDNATDVTYSKIELIFQLISISWKIGYT